MPRTIHVTDRRDRWRYVCPRDHRSWEPVDGHFWCASCSKHPDHDGVYYELKDKKTGDTLDREEIRLVTEAGPYDAGSFRDSRGGSA